MRVVLTQPWIRVSRSDKQLSQPFLFDSFQLVLAMAWKQSLIDAGVPEEVSEKIASTYQSEKIFSNSFRHDVDLDKFATSVLVNWDQSLRGDDAWSFHPAMGAWRGLLQEMRTKAGQPVEQVAAQAHPGNAVESLLPFAGFPPAPCGKITEGDREKMKGEFIANYPGVILHGGNLPSLGFLQAIMTQCKTASWAWVPWKKILSEDALLEVKSRAGKESKRAELLDLIAQSAGLETSEWDQDIHRSPHRTGVILTVCAHSCAMSGGGHLASWMSYVHKFLNHYGVFCLQIILSL